MDKLAVEEYSYPV